MSYMSCILNCCGDGVLSTFLAVMRCSLIFFFFAVLRCSGPPHVPLLKGSGVCFSNEIDFCGKIGKFDFAHSKPEFDMKFTDLQN